MSKSNTFGLVIDHSKQCLLFKDPDTVLNKEIRCLSSERELLFEGSHFFSSCFQDRTRKLREIMSTEGILNYQEQIAISTLPGRISVVLLPASEKRICQLTNPLLLSLEF